MVRSERSGASTSSSMMPKIAVLLVAVLVIAANAHKESSTVRTLRDTGFSLRDVPPDWRDGVIGGDILYSPNEPTDVMRQAYVGNGYTATVIGSDATYAVGVFNGFNSTSTRARIPATSSITIDNAWQTGSALDIRKGVFFRRSEFQQCLGCAHVKIEQRWYAHRTLPSLLVHEIHVNVTSHANELVLLELSTNMGAASKDIEFSTVSPPPLAGTTAWKGGVHAAEEKSISPQQVGVCFTTIPGTLAFNASAGNKFPQVYYYITAIRTSLDSSDPLAAACKDWQEAVALTKLPAMNDLYARHVGEWRNIWRAGLEVGGRLELAQAVNSSLYYLLSSIRPVQNKTDFPIAAYSLSPGSLSTDGYNGHSFWDAETWMYPTLALFYPPLAANVLDYRFERISPAQSKAQDYGYKGTMFPWESAFTGYEVCPWAPGSQREQHITGDIGLAVQQYWRITKDKQWLSTVGFPLISNIADFWSSRVTFNASRGLYGINGVVGPDEYATGHPEGSGIDDNAYTNVIASLCLEFAAEAAGILGKSVPSDWKYIASKMFVPFDAALQYHPEYSGYKRGQTIKQADTILLGYPLEYSMPANVAKNDLEYYAGVTDLVNGPAMTWGMFSLGYIQLRQFETAAKYFNQSYQFNINLPFFAWMETPGGGCNHFLTGAGGFLQGLWAGYGGVRIGTNALTFTPFLPEHTTYVRFRRMTYLGGHVTVYYDAQNISFVQEVDDNESAPKLAVYDNDGRRFDLIAWKPVDLPVSIGPFRLVSGN